ncbi:MAG TPA: MoaD/ThiS family protein [Candidatus Binataceae bacterium]|nr:MoaD/ThiS family protein [Candidatus Binataceae bacterium]
MAIVVIPSLLRKHTDGRDRIDVPGRNVGELIAELERRFPGFAAHLIEEGELKPSIAVSIDGEIGTAGLLEPVGDASEVHFLPAIGGGAHPARIGQRF